MTATASPALPSRGLVVRDLSKHFESRSGAVTALDDVSIDVARGEFVSVVGPSGSGKSTLLQIVAGLSSADEGTVSVLGDEVVTARTNHRIGYVPQSPALLPWRSVLENVELPFQLNRHGRRRSATERRAQRELALQALSTVGLAGQAPRFPDQLSGGMRQRVAIARALVFDPVLLLMDEPFSALDELTRERMRTEVLGRIDLSDKTVLFVTHSIAEAVALSDRVIVLSSGPGRVLGEVSVPLARPRPELLDARAQYHELEDEVRSLLRAGWTESGEEL